MPKNIIFLSDGTGNNKDFGTPTNVARLFGRCLNQLDDDEAGRPVAQIAAYDRGIGAFPTDWLAQATGMGISDNIKDGYMFLARHYEPGDRIFLFGFSRGAYTVRSIGGMLGIVGLPRRMQANGTDIRRNPKALNDLVTWAYKIYKMMPNPLPNGAQPLPGSREHGAAEFIGLQGWAEHAAPEMRAPYLIGVWDTVRSLGIPLGFTDLEVPGFSHRFHNHDLNRHVAHAYHALAIDEERLQFLPTIWNEPTAAQKHA
ncbi:MAG: phospholipase effector Tle1 domain-containing protein, partial [Bosea sp. (in: a-proteobacteria)]